MGSQRETHESPSPPWSYYTIYSLLRYISIYTSGEVIVGLYGDTEEVEVAGEREKVVGDHVLFELESPASESKEFALL